ncbi:MAG TPA: flavin reductase family protein [Methylocella sp.]|nr:flavin reductase family protein [Methylocella sp.]
MIPPAVQKLSGLADRLEGGIAPAIDKGRFFEAMSRIPAAVHIATTGGTAGLAGITATSVVSVTADPPTILFCINKTSPLAARLISNKVFCINTLTALHTSLADIFAGQTGHRLEERFAFAEWTTLVTGAPVLECAAVAFDCRLAEAKECKSHLVVFGVVAAVEYGKQNCNLTYAQRKYHVFDYGADNHPPRTLTFEAGCA